jgi:ADYC domain-containing protein
MARKMHNLCVVAMRADYLGKGTSHTINGTPVELFDASNAPCSSGSNNCNAIKLEVDFPKVTSSPTVKPSLAVEVTQKLPPVIALIPPRL